MLSDLTNILAIEFLGNTLLSWLAAACIFLAIIVTGMILESVILKRLEKFAKRTKSDIDDFGIAITKSLNWFFYASLGFYGSAKYLVINDGIEKWLNYAIMIIMVYYVVKVLQKFVNFAVIKYQKSRNEKESSMMRFFTSLINWSLWFLAVLLVLSNIGVNISSLLAGLGIGGIAIALALQSVLDDLFSSLAIYFDKPFKEDDFIIVGNDMGTVKNVGIKTTRIESLWGQEIVIPNKQITNSIVNNYKKMQRRRIHFTFGVTYQTPSKKLKKINSIVDSIFKKLKDVELDRVHFKSFGDSSLVFEVAYYVNSKEYLDYMDAQQSINLSIKEALEKEKIEFAYPTQTVYVKK